MLKDRVIRAEKLPLSIQQLEKSYKEILTEKEVKKVVRTLNKNHAEAHYSILDRYGIQKEELIKGVLCIHCSKVMERYKGGWHCRGCNIKSRNAHTTALNDYLLLINSSITNQELRSFLKLESPASATKLLKSLNYPSSGQNKGRTYQLHLIEINV
ncbi:hypothetical protein GKZ89_18875 [Bacillus mangrovi]|uniref:NERD domain-containing protein n=1 Tax=Metabacillus mangrovi TaxID=1491830 RepID=A0A7X2S840_9BACI|nr:hypothetical protein [Metabacillus mangrovi]MTH55459.1 hypothetical protein [Metabacillus mangrovi]